MARNIWLYQQALEILQSAFRNVGSSRGKWAVGIQPTEHHPGLYLHQP